MGPPAISSARLGTGPRAACKTMPCRLTKANPCFGLTVPPLTVCATNDHASSAGTQAPSGADTFVDQFGGSEPLRGSTGAMCRPLRRLGSMRTVRLSKSVVGTGLLSVPLGGCNKPDGGAAGSGGSGGSGGTGGAASAGTAGSGGTGQPATGGTTGSGGISASGGAAALGGNAGGAALDGSAGG